jgi:hypothetical protein
MGGFCSALEALRYGTYLLVNVPVLVYTYCFANEHRYSMTRLIRTCRTD